MSHLLDENDELLAPAARELTLSAGSILTIFLGLALLCGLFFGLGYNVGHRSGAAAGLQASIPEPAGAASSSASRSDTFTAFKPSPGSSAKTVSSAQGEESTDASVPPSAPAAQSPARPETAAKASVSARTAVPKSVPEAPAAAAVSGPAAPATAGSFFVQIAAISHPDDAAMLLGALRSRGYTVAERTEPGDKLIHVQVGPFSTKLTAEAMRQRLQTDGYNAIIK